MSERGFILQPTYRIEGGRAVVHLYGRLESGGTFLVRDDREVPHFYVEERNAERARAFGARVVEGGGKTTLEGRPAARVELRIPSDTPPLRNRLIEAGIRTYEADVLFALRFLMLRGIRAALEIEGEGRPGRGVDRVFENPELGPARWAPELAVLSLDIETDPKARRLLSIALHGAGAEEVLLFCPEGYPAPPGAVPFASERELLQGFCERLRELDPDVVTGWNVVDFDLAVLERLGRRHGVPMRLGRGGGTLRLRPSRGAGWSQQEATVPGRQVLDGIHLLRGAFVRMDDYSLDAVAREVLGEGKTMAGEDRAAGIVDAFLRDRPRFVEYNLTDARLVREILGELRLVELAVERSLLTGMPLHRVAGSIASFDFLYLSELAKRGVVAPSVRAGRGGEDEGNLGGHVLQPEPGLYRNVLVFDFQSLYPSVIRTFQIDPLGFRPGPLPKDADVILAPNGAAFRRQPGILSELLDALFTSRAAAKAEGDAIKSHAIKILMNSFYGVLGTRACRFYRPELASAITSFGRELLLWSKARIEGYGQRVLYGDTDSLFVLAAESAEGEEDAGLEAARRLAGEICGRLNGDLRRHVAATWGVESRFELEFEKLYRRLLLPPMRGGRGGARKRYAGLVDDGGEGRLEFTGMEVVRRDWTALAKQVQRELYARLFADRPVEAYLTRTVEALRAGELDDLVVYRKGLRKDLDEYTATTPPHVAAARKMSAPPGRLIEYVMTRGGPEPAAERRSPIDHEHYVQKQVRPVAEPVLGVLGTDFDLAIGDSAQLDLF